jgi:DNA-binding transcriptional ArsR family regulator
MTIKQPISKKRSPKKTKGTAKLLSPVALELIAKCFRALGEPMRLRLLNLLMEGECTVGQLVEASGSGQANVSKHLAVLREAGMIGMRKEGLTTRCYIADPIVNELCEMMCLRLRGEMESRAAALV